MKNFRMLNWALLLAVALPTAAFADVCQKDSPVRIHMVQGKDNSLAFVLLTGQIEAPAPVGPNTFYSVEELDKKRILEDIAIGKVSAGETGQTLGIFGLFFLLNGAAPSDHIAIDSIPVPPGPSTETRVRGAEAKENLTVLEKNLFSTSSDCIYVPSIEKHRQTLEKVLGSVYGQRFTAGIKVSNSKVEHEVRDEKSVPGSSPVKKHTKAAGGSVKAN